MQQLANAQSNETRANAELCALHAAPWPQTEPKTALKKIIGPTHNEKNKFVEF